jgi:hypothetical protein
MWCFVEHRAAKRLEIESLLSPFVPLKCDYAPAVTPDAAGNTNGADGNSEVVPYRAML